MTHFNYQQTDVTANSITGHPSSKMHHWWPFLYTDNRSQTHITVHTITMWDSTYRTFWWRKFISNSLWKLTWKLWCEIHSRMLLNICWCLVTQHIVVFWVRMIRPTYFVVIVSLIRCKLLHLKDILLIKVVHFCFLQGIQCLFRCNCV